MFQKEIIDRLNIYSGLGSGVIAVGIMFCLPQFNETALTTFGAIFLFWLSFCVNIGPAQAINKEWDISYGTYLYGWPISTLILWFFPHTNWWALSIVTLLFAYALGAISWFCLEDKAKNWRLAGVPKTLVKSFERIRTLILTRTP